MLHNLKISFFLAYKSITRGNKGTLSLTVLIMTLSFLNLMFTPALLFGMVETMNKQSIDNIFGNIVVEPGDDETYLKQVSSLQNKINGVPGVVSSSAHYFLGATFNYDENKDGDDIKTGSWSVRSINVQSEKETTKVYQTMIAGEYLDELDRDKIILGVEIAGGEGAKMKHRTLGVGIDDEIELVFNNGTARKYKVKGLFDAKDMQVNMFAFITKKEAESILGLHDRASEIIVKINQTGNEERYIQEFRRIGIIEEDIKPWTEYMGMADSMLQSFSMIKIILTLIGLLVAGITIFIVIFVSVVNRKRQIGVLKAIGMREKIIVNSYIFQALFYAFSGIVIGFILLNFLIVPYFIKNPMEFPFGSVSLAIGEKDLLITGISLVAASLIGSFIPSYRAAKESILEAIWGN